MMVDMTGGPPWLVVAAKMDKQMRYGSMMGGTVHLVDNGGELVLVHCTYRTIRDYDVGVIHETMYKVYHIDLDRGRMVPTTNLRGCAIFIDKDYKTLSVVPQVSLLIDANTIYSSIGLGGGYDAYHLRRGYGSGDSEVMQAKRAAVTDRSKLNDEQTAGRPGHWRRRGSSGLRECLIVGATPSTMTERRWMEKVEMIGMRPVNSGALRAVG
jgi:hypothetical protein